MKQLANSIARQFYGLRYLKMKRALQNPIKMQQAILAELLSKGRDTEWGKANGLSKVRTAKDFAKLPVQDYESLKGYIKRMMEGEQNVLWPGQVVYFSKSSGTTSDKSKFLPVSDDHFKQSHIRGVYDTLTMLYHNYPDFSIFSGKSFVMPGSHEQYKPGLPTIFGDVSALMFKNMPFFGRYFVAPADDLAVRAEWESKIEDMARLAIQPDIANEVKGIGGVPTWTVVFFRKILELSGKDHMLEVWPNFEVYIHGGVSMAPYREQMAQFLPSPDVIYWEVYNASEGYFATQSAPGEEDLFLLCDNGTYYEFMPMEEWGKENPRTVNLEEVEVGQNYAMLISTTSGLWRYQIGDTITFTSLNPYRIKITGRTKQFINVFGEEVMVANTDQALAQTCEALDAVVLEYTVAPIYLSEGKGGHEWLVEFEKAPADLNAFSQLLDQNLQTLNSDYEAKRYRNMALQQLRLHALPSGSFLQWMRRRGKFGNQHKVPRLSNHRDHMEQIMGMVFGE